MSILVTGGAGYIGSIAVKRLIEQGKDVTVIDNLSKGKKELVDPKARFYHIDLTDKKAVNEVFKENKIEEVIHFAAYKAVEESMSDAVKYSDNLTGFINILNACVENSVKKVVFSSTAAVYGESDEELHEESDTNPVNFYGFSKLKCEKLLSWYNQIHGIDFVALRYFNVAGDELNYKDPNAKNVFPLLMDVVNGKRDSFTVFGNDYDTHDGTCVRDYVDVRDLVDAHILALNKDYTGTINLGTGKGFSVNELVQSFREVTGVNFKSETKERREGDPGCVVASNKKAKEILGWEPKYSLKDMIKSTFDAYKD